MSRKQGPSIHPAVLGVLGVLIALALVVPLASIVGDSLEDDEETSNSDPRRTLLYRLRVSEPSDDSQLVSPFTVRVESTGTQLAMPEEGVDGAHHYALFVNKNPFTAAGEVIPQEPGVHHFAEPTLDLNLPPGVYNLVVVLADNENVRTPAGPAISVDVAVVTGSNR